MRILLVNHFPLNGSGSGIYTKNLATELARNGHKVKVIFPEHKNVTFKEFEARTIIFKNDINDNYEVDYNFPCFSTHPMSSNTFSSLNNQQMNKYIDIFVRVVEEEVIGFEPDIIHCQHIWIAPYVASRLNVPYIITAHGTDIEAFKRNERYNDYALEGAKYAKRIITISKHIDRKVKELFEVKDIKRQMILNGYDETLFKPKSKSTKEFLKQFGIEITSCKHIVSFAGKLTDIKGVDVLLKAAKIYEKQLKEEVITLIAGNGELYSELNILKNNLNLKNVYFLGHLEQETLVDLFNVADVSTVPSRFEGFGLVAIEALACGTPVVATKQGGLPDFIHDDVGTLVNVDEKALAKAIIQELTRSDSQERSKRAHEYAVNNFSGKRVAKIVEKIYEDVLNQKNKVQKTIKSRYKKLGA